jgi:protein-S-isoprenylcysteine O-methyltransferase Ste14
LGKRRRNGSVQGIFIIAYNEVPKAGRIPIIVRRAGTAAIFLWRVGAEDKLMEQQFPNEFPDYKKRTKAVIPFVW